MMLKVISIIFFISTSISQISVFEIEGVFSSAHINSLERHFKEKNYKESDLFVVQYSADDYVEATPDQFIKLFDEDIGQNDFPRAIWIGPYKTKVDIKVLSQFDYVGFTPGTRIIGVNFTDKEIQKIYCDVNICDLSNNSILISEEEGIHSGYLIAGSLGAFLDTLGSQDIKSNLTYRSKLNTKPYNFDLVEFGLNKESSNQIDFFKPSLLERLYIAISKPTFALMFFVLGFALIGLELFAMGPGIMAFIGGLLILLSSMTFQELEVNLYGILLFLVSFLIYIKVLSRGYFSIMGLSALLLQFLSSLVMFIDYIMGENIKQTISVNIASLATVSIALGIFYFVAIPTVIRSRLTTDNSSVGSLSGSSVKFIRKIDAEHSLFNIGSLEIKIQHSENQQFVNNKPYKVIEEDGSLIIQ